ncbi:MAG TPA: 4Fe-4S double cluster binding domain-containing protein, partial [Clostridia bacterium]|nr:4Fe-4S double cluster binding domain-containing protein [Clostridia bacterium]
TNAPLQAVKSEYSCMCGGCTKCVDNCPGNAIKNQKWSIDIDRDDLIDFEACRRTVKERVEKFSKEYAMCGICITVCPYTQIYLRQGELQKSYLNF